MWQAPDARRFSSGGPWVIDGAVGTELERRGVSTRGGLWSAAALDAAPEVVSAIHREYVAAGAILLRTNSFRVGYRQFSAAGRDAAAGREAARRGVALARGAADDCGRAALIAASIGPAADCYSPHAAPPDAELREHHRITVGWMADARPDLLWIETIGTRREALIAAEAARATGLPFAVSLILRERGDLLGGDPLGETVAALRVLQPVALGLNCVPPGGITRHLSDFVRLALDVPVAAYAHIGNEKPLPGWSFAESPTAGEYAGEARKWLAVGARLVGGCCGTGPAHIRALRRETAERRQAADGGQ